ncbi:MAG: LPS export ABC transporter permease LptF [Desulfobacteraceae bacterium 4572_35.2]|nr:MAG: LPS export ABC transporter permease LptF [Desulfobacteraceae bacterium 4572_35.2]
MLYRRNPPNVDTTLRHMGTCVVVDISGLDNIAPWASQGKRKQRFTFTYDLYYHPPVMTSYRIKSYIAREVITPFILGIILFTFVLLLSRLLKLIELIVDKGVPFAEIFAIFASLVPSFFVITVPLSFLLAIIIAFGRLSADSEIVAMKAAGLSLYHLAQPVVILSLFVCLFTAGLTFYGEPYGRANLRQQLIDMAFSKAAVAVTPQVFNEEIEGLVLYANKVEPETGQLSGVFISDNRMGATPSVITARRGLIYPDKVDGKLLMHLEQGAIHRLQQQKDQDSYQLVHFDRYDINLSLSDQASKGDVKALKAQEMTTVQLLKQIKQPDEEKKLDYTVELLERAILPLSPLIFSLVAIPLGIRSHRSNKGGGFAVALFVFLTYYLLLSMSKTMVIENGWPLLVTMLSPTVVFFLFSGALLYFAAKEQQMPGQKLMAKIMDKIIVRYFSGKK